MQSVQSDIITQIREVLPTTGFIAGLDDATLFKLFVKLRNNHSGRACARWLAECGAFANEDSANSAVKKFRKRISHLLVSASGTPAPQSVGPAPTKRYVENLRRSGDLDQLTQLRDASRRALAQMLAGERESGLTDREIAKRQSSLASLEKAVAAVEAHTIKHPTAEMEPSPDDKKRVGLLFRRHVFSARAYETANNVLEAFERVDERLQEMDAETLVGFGKILCNFAAAYTKHLDEKYDLPDKPSETTEPG